MGKIKKTIVICEQEYNLNIFIERRAFARVSFVNNGINIRLPRHISIQEKNKIGAELLEWAKKKIEKDPMKYRAVEIKNGLKFNIFEAKYIVFINKEIRAKNRVKVDGGRIVFYLQVEGGSEKNQNYMKKKLKDIFKKNHLKDIWQRVLSINEAYFQMQINDVLIDNATSRWGQCNVSKKIIIFSVRLLLAPIEVIDYVIVHEIAHLIEANHSRRFWEIVERVDPGYKEKIKWLNSNGHKLSI